MQEARRIGDGAQKKNNTRSRSLAKKIVPWKGNLKEENF